MQKNYNVTGEARKQMVQIISEVMEEKAVYTRMPECAYMIGGMKVTKDGAMIWEKETDATVIERIETALMITDKGDMFYSDAKGNDTKTPNGTSNGTLPLSRFLNSELIDGLILQLDNGETNATASLTYRYFPYGHSVLGTFNITLTKTLTDPDAANDGAPNPHETKETGDEREVYSLTVTYNPVNNDASTTYEKTTPGQSAGYIADGFDAREERIQSQNTHKINVFAKNLEIQKQDYKGNLIDTAKFKLFRSPKKIRTRDQNTGDITERYESTTVIKMNGEDINVVQVGEEMSTDSGKILIQYLSTLTPRMESII